jgi:hypothetical protein
MPRHGKPDSSPREKKRIVGIPALAGVPQIYRLKPELQPAHFQPLAVKLGKRLTLQARDARRFPRATLFNGAQETTCGMLARKWYAPSEVRMSAQTDSLSAAGTPSRCEAQP